MQSFEINQKGEIRLLKIFHLIITLNLAFFIKKTEENNVFFNYLLF